MRHERFTTSTNFEHTTETFVLRSNLNRTNARGATRNEARFKPYQTLSRVPESLRHLVDDVVQGTTSIFFYEHFDFVSDAPKIESM